MNIEQFLKKYHSIKSNPFAVSDLWNIFPEKTKTFKYSILKLIESRIANKDSRDLSFYLAMAWHDGIDESYKPLFKKLVLATWHDYHEEVVDCITELKDDFFSEDLYVIATTSDLYRKYDDELESTLRKCIQALKEINSSNSNAKIEPLRKTGNQNVLSVLEMYK